MQCPNCSSRNVLCTDKGLLENSYVCQGCRHEFDGVGTGVKRVSAGVVIGVATAILTGGAAVPAIIAALISSGVGDD